MPDAIPGFHDYKGYRIYFWSDEGEPLEPVHVNVSKGTPHANATKYWIKQDGTVEAADPGPSDIPAKDLRNIESRLEEYSPVIIRRWTEFYKESPRFHQ